MISVAVGEGVALAGSVDVGVAVGGAVVAVGVSGGRVAVGVSGVFVTVGTVGVRVTASSAEICSPLALAEPVKEEPTTSSAARVTRTARI
jgi:hypothetical protein